MTMIRGFLSRNFSKFNNMQVGDAISRTRKITKNDIEKFSILSGDYNVVHSIENSKPIVHGAFLNTIVSGIIGTELPGHGTLVLKQTLNFPNMCYCDETVKTTVEVVKLRKIIEVKFKCVVEDVGKVVMEGDAKLMFNK